MRKLIVALIASAAFAVGACAPGGTDRTTGPTLDPSQTVQPGSSDPLASPSEPAGTMTMAPAPTTMAPSPTTYP